MKTKFKNINEKVNELVQRFHPLSTQEEIYELINIYYDNLDKVTKVKQSIYSSYPDYNSYTYLIYNKMNFKFYIGVRYTNIKYHQSPLEDLKIYKSSSRNGEFKNDLSENPENYEFEILEEFNNEFEAIYFEALLHQIYKVNVNENCYNLTMEIFPSTIFYTIKMWDFKLSREFGYSQIPSSRVKENLRRLSNENVDRSKMLVLGRYCLWEYREDLRDAYIKTNKLITLYKFNNIMGRVESFTRPHYHWVYVINYYNFPKLLRGENKSLQGYYIEFNICELENKEFSLYNRNGEVIVKKLYEWKVILGVGYRSFVIDRKYKYFQEYWLDKNTCKEDNKYYTFYKYNKKSKEITEKNIRKVDCPGFLGPNSAKLFSGNINYINGWYLDKNLLMKNYQKFKIEHIETGLIKEIYYCDGLKEVGKNYQNLFQGTIGKCNGYRLI